MIKSLKRIKDESYEIKYFNKKKELPLYNTSPGFSVYVYRVTPGYSSILAFLILKERTCGGGRSYSITRT